MLRVASIGRPSLSYTERHYFDPHWIPLRDKMVNMKDIMVLVNKLRKGFIR